MHVYIKKVAQWNAKIHCLLCEQPLHFKMYGSVTHKPRDNSNMSSHKFSCTTTLKGQ